LLFLLIHSNFFVQDAISAVEHEDEAVEREVDLDTFIFIDVIRAHLMFLSLTQTPIEHQCQKYK